MKSLTTILLCGLSIFAACASAKPEVALSEKYPVISLDRSGCFGSCPAYTLTLRGDGSATYIGKSDVQRVGNWRAKVDEKSLRYLMSAFEAIKFFELKDVYDDMVTDIPTYTLSYQLGDSTKKVTDRFGPPPGLRELERSIDSVAETLKWNKVAAE